MLRKITLLMFIFLLTASLSAFAQTSSTPRDTSNHWEIEFHGGGVFSGSLGDNRVTCTDTITGACSTSPGDYESIGPNGENVPQPLLTTLPLFMNSGQVRAGSGFSGGARIGYDITPNWQIEFTWDYNNAPIEYDQGQISAIMSGITLFCDPSEFSACNANRNIAVTDRTRDRGHQNSYMVNVNYQWNTDRKFVPYVTFGAGAVDWSAGSSFFLLQTKPGGNCGPQTTNPNCRLSFFKKSQGDMGFGVNFGAGAKYYFHKNWGLRAEVKDTLSWVDFSHTFASVDIDGDDTNLTPGSLIPPSGTGKQNSSAMNQLNVSGGLFFRF